MSTTLRAGAGGKSNTMGDARSSPPARHGTMTEATPRQWAVPGRPPPVAAGRPFLYRIEGPTQRSRRTARAPGVSGTVRPAIGSQAGVGRLWHGRRAPPPTPPPPPPTHPPATVSARRDRRRGCEKKPLASPGGTDPPPRAGPRTTASPSWSTSRGRSDGRPSCWDDVDDVRQLGRPGPTWCGGAAKRETYAELLGLVPRGEGPSVVGPDSRAWGRRRVMLLAFNKFGGWSGTVAFWGQRCPPGGGRAGPKTPCGAKAELRPRRLGVVRRCPSSWTIPASARLSRRGGGFLWELEGRPGRRAGRRLRLRPCSPSGPPARGGGTGSRPSRPLTSGTAGAGRRRAVLPPTGRDRPPGPTLLPTWTGQLPPHPHPDPGSPPGEVFDPGAGPVHIPRPCPGPGAVPCCSGAARWSFPARPVRTHRGPIGPHRRPRGAYTGWGWFWAPVPTMVTGLAQRSVDRRGADLSTQVAAISPLGRRPPVLPLTQLPPLRHSCHTPACRV